MVAEAQPATRSIPAAGVVTTDWLAAAVAVLPLVVPGVWFGFSIGVADTALGAISAMERPLSVRSVAGMWAVALAVGWFGLAFRDRRIAWWEPLLVALGGAAALARIGNMWLDALLLLAPLTRRFGFAGFGGGGQVVLGAVALAVAAASAWSSQPPQLPRRAVEAALAAPGSGRVLSDWRWAGALQDRLGTSRGVLGQAGLRSESDVYWVAYVKISQGNVRWDRLLGDHSADLVVLDGAGSQRAAADAIRASATWLVLFDEDGALVAARIGP